MPPLNRRLVIDPTQRLEPDRIQPSQMRGSTYTAPAQPRPRTDLSEFLNALGGASDTVSKIAKRREADKEQDDTLAAQKAFDGMSLGEARELVASKKINDYESPYFRAAFLARLGQNEAANRKRDLVKRFEDPTQFDPINGNVESFVDEQTKADLARLPQNDFVTRAYLGEIEGFASQLANKQVDAQVREIATARKDQVGQSINNALIGAQQMHGAVTIERVTKPALQASPGAATPQTRGSGVTHASFDFNRLAGAVMSVESRGNPNAVSPKGAVGTMQTMPGTLRAPGFGVKPAKDGSPAELERVGRDYLQAMLKRYGGNVTLALAAYNAGPGRLEGWTDSNGKKHPGWLSTIGDPRRGGMSSQEWAARIPIAETRDYVPKVLAGSGGGADGVPMFMDDEGPVTLPDGTVVESATQRLADPGAYASAVFTTIEENAKTGLATRREQEDMLLALLPDLANQGRDAELLALLDHDRGPAGTLRSKLGPRAELLIEAAKSKREGKEDESAAAGWEDTQYTLGLKADAGKLTEDDINKAKRFAIDERVALGRKPLAGGEYFAGLVARQRAFNERQAEIARREAEKAAELAAEAAANARLDQIYAAGLGHELTGGDETKARERAYERNRMTAGDNHIARRALDLKTYQQTNQASPFSQRLLERGGTALRAGVGIGTDGKVSSQLAIAVQEYGFYRKHAPQALRQIVADKDRDLFDLYYSLTGGEMMTSQQALLRVQAYATGEFRPAPLSNRDRAEIRSAIKSKSARNGLFGLVGGWLDAKEGGPLDTILYEDQDNRSLVVSAIERRAATLMRAGATKDAAVRAATARELSNWSQFDGVLVNHNGTPVPQFFKKGLAPAVDLLLETKLKGTGYEKPANGIIGWHRENVMVQAHPNAPGKWLLIDRDNLRAPLAVISTQDIQRAAAEAANAPSILDRARNVFNQPLIRIRREDPTAPSLLDRARDALDQPLVRVRRVEPNQP